jgi:YidC/Oxa1 family membrane protein insertase
LLAQLEANKKAPSQKKTSGLMAKLEALQKEQERLQKERQDRLNKK